MPERRIGLGVIRNKRRPNVIAGIINGSMKRTGTQYRTEGNEIQVSSKTNEIILMIEDKPGFGKL